MFLKKDLRKRVGIGTETNTNQRMRSCSFLNVGEKGRTGTETRASKYAGTGANVPLNVDLTTAHSSFQYIQGSIVMQYSAH